MPITNDTEMLKTLGISESEAAALVSRTRQTINIGLKREAHYFEFPALLTIRSHCVGNRNPRLNDLDQYIAATRGKVVLEDIIQMQNAGLLRREQIEAAREVWAVIPYFRAFKFEYPDQFSRLVEIAKQNPAGLTVFVESERDAEQFRTATGLAPENQPTVRVLSNVEFLPHYIFLEPNSSLMGGWILTSRKQFFEMDRYRADGILDYIKAALGSDKTPPAPIQAAAAIP